MNTPIADFANEYMHKNPTRLHVPGHKGIGTLGLEALDITEIAGADDLYNACGIIAQSEQNATGLFGTAKTLYSTEGSSQCIRAMLYLAMTSNPNKGRAICLATRNAHKSLIYAAALCDIDIEWLYPINTASSLCACPITADDVNTALINMQAPPICVYLTSPDYLGNMLDISSIATVCHAHNVPLIVDNAHGAYLKFLENDLHPISLGADMCCDSAHKTLPVLTGGALLHISKSASTYYAENARRALALFGSTSPSYLILQSLDAANALLAGTYQEKIRTICTQINTLKQTLKARDFTILGDEPMKLTLLTDGLRTAEMLRQSNIECEYADKHHLVMMFSASNTQADILSVERTLLAPLPCPGYTAPAPIRLERAMSIRDACFAPCETIKSTSALGRICALPTVSCPPAIPIAISGEIISAEAVNLLINYGIDEISVIK